MRNLKVYMFRLMNFGVFLINLISERGLVVMFSLVIVFLVIVGFANLWTKVADV